MSLEERAVQCIEQCLLQCIADKNDIWVKAEELAQAFHIQTKERDSALWNLVKREHGSVVNLLRRMCEADGPTVKNWPIIEGLQMQRREIHCFFTIIGPRQGDCSMGQSSSGVAAPLSSITSSPLVAAASAAACSSSVTVKPVVVPKTVAPRGVTRGRGSVTRGGAASARPVNGRKHDLIEIERVYLTIRMQHHARGDAVEPDLVERDLLAFFKVPTIFRLVHHPNDIQAHLRLVDMRREVDSLIVSGAKVQACVTLSELEDFVVHHSSIRTAKSFDDLALGPFIQQARVRIAFDLQHCLPPLIEIPKTRFEHVISATMNLMDRGSFKGQKFTPKDIKAQIARDLNMQSEAHVGARINSIGLLITSISAAKRNSRAAFNDTLAVTVRDVFKHAITVERQVLAAECLEPSTDIIPLTLSTDNWLKKLETPAMLQDLVGSSTSKKKLMQLFQFILSSDCGDDLEDTPALLRIQECLGRIMRALDNDALHGGERRLSAVFLQWVFHTASIAQLRKILIEIVQMFRGISRWLDRKRGYTTVSTPNRASVAQGSILVEEIELQHAVASAAKELASSPWIVALPKIEAHVLAKFNGEAFYQFGHGSFVEFLGRNANLLTEVQLESTIRADGQSSTLDTSALSQNPAPHRRMLESEAALLQSIDGLPWSWCAWFVGHDEKFSVTSDSSRIKLSALPSLLLMRGEECAPKFGLIDEDDATKFVQAIADAPVLEEISRHLKFETKWRQLFPPGHNSLFSCLSLLHAHYPELLDDSVELYFDTCYSAYRLDPAASLETLENAVSSLDSRLTAASILAIAAFGDDPFSYREMQVCSQLKSLFQGIVRPRKDWTMFLLNVLSDLPCYAADSLVSRWLLAPAKEALGSIEEDLWSLAEQDSSFPHHIATLSRLAYATGSILWMKSPERSIKRKEADTISQSYAGSAAKLAVFSTLGAPIARKVREMERPSVNIVSLSSRKNKNAEGIIEGIRVNHGIGESGKVLDLMKQRVSRAVKRLSAELYSSKTHFVMELLQNCDDNEYELGVVPRVRFEIDETFSTFTAKCNELGFTEEQVKSICDIGASTKALRKGFIGQKGIGFKSTFSVSDEPEVHSAGFHFRFSKETFVVPEWIADCACDCGDDGFSTHVTLPLAAHARSDMNVKRQLDDIDVMLLLFLQKIRQIEICYPERQMILCREDDGNVVELTTATLDGEIVRDPSTFFVYKRPVEVPRDIQRGDMLVEETEVALAFVVSQSTELMQQPAFAFLPLRSYGLKFVVQADFIVNSARDEVLADDEWNTFLQQHVVHAFLEAFENLRSADPAAVGTLSSTRFFSTVPLAADLPSDRPFFKALAFTICKRLQQINCIVSASTGEWLPPSRCISLCRLREAERELLQEQISAPWFAEATNLNLVDEAFATESGLTPKIMDALGVTHCSWGVMLKATRVRVAAWSKLERADAVQEDTFFAWLSSFICSAYRLVKSSEGEEKFREEFSRARIFPLRHGTEVVALTRDEGHLFLDEDGSSLSLPSAVLEHIAIIHHKLLSCASGSDRILLKNLLTSVGVRISSRKSILKDAIIPLLASPASSRCSDESIVALLRYGGSCFTLDECISEPPSSQAPDVAILCSDGQRKRLQDVAVGADYDERVRQVLDCFPEVFADRLFISSCYLDEETKPDEWVKYLEWLGISALFRFEIVRDPVIKYATLQVSPWANCVSSDWAEAGPILVRDDVLSSDIDLCLTILAAKHVRSQREDAMDNEDANVVRCAAALWNAVDFCLERGEFPDEWLEYKARLGGDSVPRVNFPTSLLANLSTRRWVPVSSPSAGISLIKPPVAFALADFAPELPSYNRHLPLLSDSCNSRGLLGRTLLRKFHAPTCLVDVLVEYWDADKANQLRQLPALLMKDVYRDLLLGTQSLPPDMRIFVPITDNEGFFRERSLVVWKDPANDATATLGILYTLEKHFKDVSENGRFPDRSTENLFVERFNISRVPLWGHHVQALQELSSAKQLPASDMARSKRATLAESIIGVVARAFARNRMDIDGILSWATSLKFSNLLPSLDRKCWVSARDAVVQDDDDLYRMFKPVLEDVSDLTIVSKCGCSTEEELAFFDQVEIRRLSQCVQTQSYAQSSRPASRQVAAWIQHLILALQLFAKTEEPQLYETIYESHRNSFQSYSVVEAEELSIVHSFDSALSTGAVAPVQETGLILVEVPFISVHRSAVIELIERQSRDLPSSLCSALAELIFGRNDFKSHKFLQSHWRDHPSEIVERLGLHDVPTEHFWRLRTTVESPEHADAALEKDNTVDFSLDEIVVQSVALDMGDLPAWASTTIRERPAQASRITAPHQEPPLSYVGQPPSSELQNQNQYRADDATEQVASRGEIRVASNHTLSRSSDETSHTLHDPAMCSQSLSMPTMPTTEFDDAQSLSMRMTEVDARSFLHADFGDLRAPTFSVQPNDALAVLSANAKAVSFPDTHADVLPTDTAAIGRLGEERVVAYLHGRYAFVEWVNEKKESGLPFDIRVRDSDDSHWHLVEVKSTVSDDSAVQFHISPREVYTAVECGEQYTVFYINLKLRTLHRLKHFASMLSSEALHLLVFEAKTVRNGAFVAGDEVGLVKLRHE